MMPLKGGKATLQRKMSVGNLVFYNLPQIEIDERLHAETEMKVQTVKGTGDKFIELIATLIGHILIVGMQKPVMVSAQRVLVDNGVKDLLLHIILSRELAHINDIGCELVYGVIGLDIGKYVVVIAYVPAFDIRASDFLGIVPDIHYHTDDARQQHGNPTAIEELRKVGYKEDTFQDYVKTNNGEDRPPHLPHMMQIASEEQCGHKHRYRNGKSVRRLHIARGTEQQYDYYAEHIKADIYKGNIELALHICRILDALPWPEVQVHGFTEDGEGTADKCLARHYCRNGSHGDANGQESPWHNGIERIQPRLYLAAVGYYPSTLPEVVADEHCLYEHPAYTDILLAAMPKVGI